MRKFLFLLVALIMSVASAWAQETVSGAAGTIYTSPALVDGNFASGTKFYTIAINRNNCMLDSRYLPTVQQKKAAACDENKWAVLAVEGGYQFINKATKEALTFASSANDATASLTKNFEDTNSFFEFTTSQNSSFQSDHEVFRIAGTDDAYPNDKGVGLAIWASAQALWGWGASAEKPSTGDAGSQFKFTMVEELVLNTFSFTLPDGVTVTYDGKTYSNGQSVQVMGAITTTQVTVNETAPTGYHYDIQVDATNHVVTVTLAPDPVLSIDDINPNKAYYIYTVARGGLTLKSAEDTRLWGTSEAGVGQTVDGTNPLQQFAFITYKDNLYLYSIGAQKFVNSSSTGKLEDTPADPIGFANPGEGSVRLLFSSSMNFNLGGDKQVTIGTWSTKDDGNKFIILPAADFDPAPVLEALNSTTFVDVTYMVTNVDGVEVPYVVEHVKAGELAAIPEISGYLIDPVMTDTDCIVSETNKTFHVTGTWEFPFDESKYYTMHSAKTDEYQDYVCNGTAAWCNGSVAVADNNNVWQLAHVAGTLDLFTLKNYGYNKYAVLSGSGRNACTFAAEPTVWTEGTGATSYFRVVKQNGGFNLQHPGDAETNVGSHVDYKLGSWKNVNSATNASSINIVTETTPTVPAAKATVVYNYNYAGSLWKSVSVEQTVGEAVAAPAIAFANLEYDNETLVSEDGNTVEVTVTDNLPFVAAADYASITKWYNVRLHSNQTHYMYMNEDAVAFTDAVAETNKNAYAWAFIGNLKDGFKMVNYVAGESKAVNNDDPCAMSEEGYAFPIVATTENVAGGFCFESATGSYLNYQGAAIKRWNEADAGSTFRVTEVEIDENPVTPPTDAFPAAGTYYVTFTGQASGRNNCLYNDLTQADGYTLQSASQPNPLTNAYIWKAECDGTNMTIVNGQGSTMKLKNNTGDKEFNVLYYVAHSGNYYLKPVLTEGTLSNNGHDCLNVSNGSYANAAGTPCLTSWSTTAGPDAGDNLWAVGVVDATELTEYTVTVTGAEGGYVIFGEQKAANGGFFLVSEAIAESALTAAAVRGFDATVTVSGTTITVEYTASSDPDWEGLYEVICDTYPYELGDGLGQYSYMIFDTPSNDVFEKTMEYYEGVLEAQEATAEEVESAISTIRGMIDALQLNMPKAGSFLRMYGVTNSNYLLGTLTNSGSKFAMGAGEDATSVFYYDGSHLLSYSTGRYVGTTSSKWQWNIGEGSEINFHDATTAGAYRVRVPKDSGSNPYVFLYSGAANATNADRGGFATVEACSDTKYQWYLEEVETLPVTIGAAGLATLYAPVALQIPEGVTAYTIAENGEYLKATAFTGVIPANTGVVLEATAGVYNFDITTGGEATSCLTGTVPTINKVDGALVLGVVDGQEGFYSPKAETLAGFKAYYVNASGSNFRITFDNLTDIISAVKENGGQAIFDLQGRRVVNAKGVTIQNGKKVVK